MEQEALTNCRVKRGTIQGTERMHESVGYSHTVKYIGAQVKTWDETKGARSTHWLLSTRKGQIRTQKKMQARGTHSLSNADSVPTKGTEEKVSR